MVILATIQVILLNNFISKLGHIYKVQDSYEYGNYTQCLKTHISYCTRSGCDYRDETTIGETSHDIHYLYTAGGKEYGTCTNCGHSGYYINSWTFTS